MVELEHISVRFHYGDGSTLQALDQVSLSIPEGSFVTVVGNNGAGKSTLLNVLAGTLSPTKGRVYIAGKEVTHWSEVRRARWIARVFANAGESTCGNLTVAENFAVALRRGERHGLGWYLRAEERERIREQVARLGLGLEAQLDRPMEQLSSGQRQSLSVLMATLTHPKLLLLDEHVANLDPETADRVMALTESLIHEEHLTALMVTHEIPYALAYGDRLIAMERGQVLLDLDAAQKCEVSEEKLRDLYRSRPTATLAAAR